MCSYVTCEHAFDGLINILAGTFIVKLLAIQVLLVHIRIILYLRCTETS